MRNLAILCSVVLLSAFSTTASTLTVTPITWDVVGLDSNNVNAGPNLYLVGVRIKNTSATTASNVVGTFAWDDGNNLFTGDPYINLQSVSLSTLSVPTLAAGASTDFYYNVVIT